MTLKHLLLAFTFSGISLFSLAQEVPQPKKDNKKIQEVVTLDPAPQAEGDTGVAKPLAQSEILKRALNFIRLENDKYAKSNILNVGSKAECVATFNYKPKELNPQSSVEGTYSMHLSIEAKDGKYRYTISKINHTAKNSEYTGGDIYNEVPACGSMKLSTPIWKQMKSQALKDATTLIADLKEGMKNFSNVDPTKDEW